MLSFVLLSCNEKETKSLDADEIINKTIEVSGVKKLNTSILTFDFRNKSYVAARFNGNYEFQRRYSDSVNDIRDFLNNKGFERYLNDSVVSVPDSMATKYASSINSVHYFAVLPHGLDGKAVNKAYLNDVEIKGKRYHKIKVTFDKNGGGEDYDDEFIYWIDNKTNKIDYLAYSYNEDDGKGLRFREAYNERYIKDVRFVDYNNYEPKRKDATLENLDELFEENQLKLLSKIELKNIKIN